MPDQPSEGQGFFSRWSSRKQQAQQGVPPPDPQGNAIDLEASSRHADSKPPPIDATPAPSLDDVEQLTPDSDFSRFARPDVDPKVRNAALRKLFAADPHFNVMDGLDVYIDDYSQGEAIPKAMLRQMVQARALGLLDDELEDQDKPPSADLSAGLAANDTAPIHENADLQLQRDAAAEPGSAEASADPQPDLGEPRPG